jgi:hypothetical protein
LHVVERIGNVTTWLIALTDFGDLAVLIPLAAAIHSASSRLPLRGAACSSATEATVIY